MMVYVSGRLPGGGNGTPASIANAEGIIMTDIPTELWVIVRSTGEYSDRDKTPIRYCLTEADAQRAIELVEVESQRDVGLKPAYRRSNLMGYQFPDGSWLDDGVDLMDPRASGGRWMRKPNADEIEAQNELWAREYEAAVLALGHVDPGGSWRGDSYYYCSVSLWPADSIGVVCDERG